MFGFNIAFLLLLLAGAGGGYVWYQNNEAEREKVIAEMAIKDTRLALVEEAMRRAFYERFQSDIPVTQEVINWSYRKKESLTKQQNAMDIDTILKADDDVSQWRTRHELWYAISSK